MLADAGVQTGVGHTPFSYLAMGFAKGNANGGSVAIAAGAGLNIKAGVYLAASAAIDQSDAAYIHGLGGTVGGPRLIQLIDYLTARYL